MPAGWRACGQGEGAGADESVAIIGIGPVKRPGAGAVLGQRQGHPGIIGDRLGQLAVASAAQAAGVVTQLGTQHASGIGDRMAVHWLREGVIGKFKRVITCSNRTGAVENYRLKGPRPAQGEPVPANLAWDLWLGKVKTPKLLHLIYQYGYKWKVNLIGIESVALQVHLKDSFEAYMHSLPDDAWRAPVIPITYPTSMGKTVCKAAW